MRALHGIALTLLTAGLSSLPALAMELETLGTQTRGAETLSTAMLSSEPLSTDLLKIQMFGTVMPAEMVPAAKAVVPEITAPRTSGPASSRAARQDSRLTAIRAALQKRLSESFSATTTRKTDQKGALITYYAEPERQLLWVDETGLTARGKAAIAEIERADTYGLNASDYTLPGLDHFDASATDATATLAAAEIEISQAVLDYVHDARGGRINPRSVSRNLDPNLVLPDPVEVIESIAFRADPAAYLRSFQPQHPQFERLRQRLIALRGGSEPASGYEPEIQMPLGSLLQLGVVDPQVALLRTRLQVPQGDNPEFYDDTIAQAVKKFQREHNTSADGIVGPGTRALLNKPHLRNSGSPAVIKKVLLNMERWRWLPQDQGAFFVTVNVPEFMLRVVKDDETIHTTRVIVGKSKTPTPIFSNDMKSVVFGPYWNVPNSIKTGEIRPYIRPYGGWYGRRWDTRVLQQHELHIKFNGQTIDPASIDWSRVDIRKLHLYQPPSPNNVLGRVKFMFPNKHDVYMHDTPQKHFFQKSVRAESHGCMRVQKPDAFAAVILKHDRNWNADKTQSAFDTGYDKHVALNTPVPVYVTYFTLWVNEDGSITTFEDLYGHDRRMSVALLKNDRSYVAAKKPPAAQPVPMRQSQQTHYSTGSRYAQITR